MSTRAANPGERHPLRALLLVALLVVTQAALAAEPGAQTTPSELFGAKTWQVRSLTIAGEPFTLSSEVSTELELASGLRALSGTVGCNRMTAPFELGPEPGRIVFSPIVATLMACPEPAMSQERAIFDALEAVDSYASEPGRVTLSGPGVAVVLAARADSDSDPTAGERGFGAFNAAVASAAAAGAPWPSDAVRVALALVELSGAAETTIVASYGAPGSAGGLDGPRDLAQVTVTESGLLDDSLAGVVQRLSLALEGGLWVVSAHEIVWRCARGPDAERVEPQRCP